MPRWPRARSTPAVPGVRVVYSIRGSEGNNTRSRSISCDRAWPDNSGSTTARAPLPARPLPPPTRRRARAPRPPPRLRYQHQQHLPLGISATELREGLGNLAQLGGLHHRLRRQLRFPRNRLLAVGQPSQNPLDPKLELMQSGSGRDRECLLQQHLGPTGPPEPRLAAPLLQVQRRPNGGRPVREPVFTTLPPAGEPRSEEHTSELQSLAYLVCRLLLEKKKNLEAAAVLRSRQRVRHVSSDPGRHDH